MAAEDLASARVDWSNFFELESCHIEYLVNGTEKIAQYLYLVLFLIRIMYSSIFS